MKKILSFIIVFVSLLILSACGNTGLGEFPEVKESKKVEMTVDEVNTLLADVDMETQMKQAMMLSIDLNLKMDQEVNGFFSPNKVSDNSLSLIMSSKTYVSFSDQIDEVSLLSQNTINYNMAVNYVDELKEDTDEKIEGKLNAYFTNQYLYYDAQVTGLEDNEFIKDGKYKMNLGITQLMWDQIYNTPEGLLDDFAGIEINPAELIDNNDMMAFMMEEGFISIYKSGSTYTLMIAFTKQDIIDKKRDLFDAMKENEAWTEEYYVEFEADLDEMLAELQTLDLSIGIVIKDGVVEKMGVEIDIKMVNEQMSLDLSAKIVMDMNIKFPDFPKDLDEYKLTDLPLNFLN